MKHEICTALLTLGLAGTLGNVMLNAQDRPREIGNVPFAFQVADTTLPAGQYSATELNANGLVKLTNEATSQSIMVTAFVPKDGQPGQSKLSFRCYSGHCFLSEIWYPQESSGHGLKTSRLEKEMAANSHEDKKIYVAMR